MYFIVLHKKKWQRGFEKRGEGGGLVKENRKKLNPFKIFLGKGNCPLVKTTESLDRGNRLLAKEVEFLTDREEEEEEKASTILHYPLVSSE